VDKDRTSGEGKMSYKRVPIPSADNVSSWVDALQNIHEATSGRADASTAVDIALRFSMLAYSRNDGLPAVGRVLQEAWGTDAVIELQLHGTNAWDAGAHCVAYIYKLEEGVGVVLAYKGSTSNMEDWIHNVKFLTSNDGSVSSGKPLFSDMQGPLDSFEARAEVHPGFLAYKQSLDARMKNVAIEKNLRDMLESWGSVWEKKPSGRIHFHQWLHSPNAWKWCVVVGHSLGGAMAQVSAADLAVRSNGRVLLATVGSPTAGNTALAKLLNDRVEPNGGLRIKNVGDTVTKLGFNGIANSDHHAGRLVSLPSSWLAAADYYHTHLRYKVPSQVNGQNDWKMMTFSFPGETYKPTKVNDLAELNLKHFASARIVIRCELRTDGQFVCESQI